MGHIDRTLLYSEIGRRIKQSRERQHETQSSLAKKISVTRASIVNIEKGRQHPPLHLIWEIAIVLDIDPKKLIPDVKEIVDIDADLIIEAQIEKQSKGNEEKERLLQFLKDQDILSNNYGEKTD